MKLQIIQEPKTYGAPRPISCKLEPSIVKNTNNKIDSLKLDIKKHPGEIYKNNFSF